MELPHDIVMLIKDYSRPLTRPDWRTLHKMTNLSFHLAVARELNFTCPTSVYNLIMNPQSDFLYSLSLEHVPYIEYIYNIKDWSRYYVHPDFGL